MASSIKQQMQLKDWLTLIVLSVLWGGSFFFVGLAVGELSPIVIVAVRLILATLALWLVLLAIGYRFPRGLALWGSFLVMGLLNNVIPFLLIVWGQTHIASGLASILNATTPLFTVVVAGLCLSDEKMKTHKVIGVLLGFVGVVVLIGPSALSDLGTHVFAQLAILGAAFAYSLAAAFGRRFKTMGVEPMVLAVGQLTASSLVLLPIMLLSGQAAQLVHASLSVWLSLVGLAVLSTALAYALYFHLLASAGATNASLVTFLIPISAIVLGFLFLGEVLKLEHFLGMGFIGLGLCAIDGRLWKRLRQ